MKRKNTFSLGEQIKAILNFCSSTFILNQFRLLLKKIGGNFSVTMNFKALFAMGTDRII